MTEYWYTPYCLIHTLYREETTRISNNQGLYNLGQRHGWSVSLPLVWAGHLQPGRRNRKNTGGEKLPLGVWADVEITSWSKLSRKQLEIYLKLARESFGDDLGIYTSQYMWDSSIGAPVLGTYKLWIANYQVERPNLPKKGLWEDWWLWQYTNKGRIDGVGLNLDLSYFNGTEEEFEEWTGGEAQETNILRIERLERALEKLCVKLGIDSDSILN